MEVNSATTTILENGTHGERSQRNQVPRCDQRGYPPPKSPSILGIIGPLWIYPTALGRTYLPIACGKGCYHQEW